MRRVARHSGGSWVSRARSLILPGVILLATMVLNALCLRDELDPNVPTPQFLLGLTNITTRRGDQAILPCSVRYLGTKGVAWRRIYSNGETRFLTIGDMTWTEDENISLDHKRKHGDVTTWNLLVSNAQPEDAGIYECQVTSRAGMARNVTLNVVGPPVSKPDGLQHSFRGLGLQDSSVGYQVPSQPVSVCGVADLHGCLISITGNRFVDVGQKIELKCNASGGTQVAEEMDWFKGGDKIDSIKYRHVAVTKYKNLSERSFISTLTIDHGNLSDTGNYICRSSRNDIADLKVTVLHAQSWPIRRGTSDKDPEAGRSSKLNDGQWDDNDSSRASSRHHHQASYLFLITFSTLLFILSQPVPPPRAAILALVTTNIFLHATGD